MQRESLFKYSQIGTTYQQEPLKVLLKLIFNKYKRRNSRESSKIIMSELKEDPLFTTSKEKLTEYESKCETFEPEVINLDLDETISQMRGTNSKRRIKTIKIKITISEADDTQHDQIPDPEVTVVQTISEDATATCVIEQCDDDSSSLVSKSLEKEKKINYVRKNEDNLDNKIDIQMSSEATTGFNTTQKSEYDLLKNEQTTNIRSEIANTKRVDTPNVQIQRGIEEVIPFTTIEKLKAIDFLKMDRLQCCINDTNKSTKNKDPLKEDTLAYRNTSSNSENIKESIINFLASEKINANSFNNEQKEGYKIDKKAKLQKITSPINNIIENTTQPCDMTQSNKEKCFHADQWSIKEISNRFIEAEKQFTPIDSSKLDTKDKLPNQLSESFDLGKSKDSLIIHEIIMEHYHDILNYFNKKISKRDMYRKCMYSVDEKEKVTEESVKSHLYNLCCDQEETQLNRKSLDSGLDDMNISKSMDTLENRCSNDEKVEYNSREFLMEALGPDLLNMTSMSQAKLEDNSTSVLLTTDYSHPYGIEKSIGSSEISTLVSNTDCKSDIYSLYSTVKKERKKKSSGDKSVVCPLFPSASTNIYNDYESIDKFRIYSKADELSTEISALQKIAAQVSNAISLCNSKPNLYGTMSHLEAERLLLLTNYKIEVLNNDFEKYEYEEIEQVKSCGTIKIKSLKFSRLVDSKVDKTKSEKQCYLCLIHSRTTIFASEISFVQENGDIIFNKPMDFNFDGLLSDVEIKFRIYSIKIKNNQNKKISCFSPNKIYSPRKHDKRCNKSDSTNPDTSQLLGNGRISYAELSCENKFKLNAPLHETISDTFNADILIQVKLNNTLSGFLTISTRHAMWNRRWCSLDGHSLMYWSCPSEESDVAPAGIIDLRTCITINVSSADKSVCSRARTFVLEVKSEMAAPKIYFLSADNLSEFTKWKRQINVTLAVLRKWNELKCQTELLN